MARAQTLTRYELLASDSSERMNVLLDNDFLNPGQEISLEGADQRWLVIKRHETLQRASINYGWKNNI
jgi:hypothetical protein